MFVGRSQSRCSITQLRLPSGATLHEPGGRGWVPRVPRLVITAPARSRLWQSCFRGRLGPAQSGGNCDIDSQTRLEVMSQLKSTHRETFSIPCRDLSRISPLGGVLIIFEGVLLDLFMKKVLLLKVPIFFRMTGV